MLLCASGSAVAQTAPELHLLVDDNSLTVEQAQQAFEQGRFQRLPADRAVNLDFTAAAAWLRFDFVAPATGEYVVTIGGATLDEVVIRATRDDGTTSVHRGGLLVPARDQERTRVPAARLSLRAGERIAVLARARSQNELALPVAVERSDVYAAREARSTAWRFLFYGLLLSMGLLNLFMFAFTRERASLAYFGFLLAMVLWLCSLDGTLRVFAPWVFELSPRWPFFVGGAGSIFFGTLFLVWVLRLSEVWPRLARWAPRLVAALLFLSLLAWAVGDWRRQNECSGVNVMFGMVMSLSLALSRWRRGSAIAGYVVAGWVFYAAGALITVLSVNSPRPPLFEALHAGVAAEAVCFALALADDARRRSERIRVLHLASTRFVPAEFLRLLGREELPEVTRGDQVARTMTVFFSDIRSFTTMSEKLSPEQTMALVNEYLDFVEPVIRGHHGVIDKYIGDAVMALFDKADDALAAAKGCRAALEALNEKRVARGEPAIDIGTGIHTGPLVLGTVGTGNRLSCTVIGDTVNVASRIEGLTKTHGASILLSDATARALVEKGKWRLRSVGTVRVKGKVEETLLHALEDEAPGVVSAVQSA